MDSAEKDWAREVESVCAALYAENIGPVAQSGATPHLLAVMAPLMTREDLACLVRLMYEEGKLFGVEVRSKLKAFAGDPGTEISRTLFDLYASPMIIAAWHLLRTDRKWRLVGSWPLPSRTLVALGDDVDVYTAG